MGFFFFFWSCFGFWFFFFLSPENLVNVDVFWML